MVTAQQAHMHWAEIDLDALVHNFGLARNAAHGREVMCVVKADAYGHGAVPVARALARAGAAYFAVATPEEALQLRRHGVTGRVLVLGLVSPRRVAELHRNNVELAVGSLACAKAYAAARAADCASPLKVHIKLDTGLARLGLGTGAAALEEALAIAALPGIEAAGLFTHFAVADDPSEDAYTEAQMQLFTNAAAALEARGFAPPLLHCANSPGLMAHPTGWGNAVRPGIMLYGVNPCQTDPQGVKEYGLLPPPAALPLRPVLSLRARIAQLHRIPAGQTVSYGRTWAAPEETLVATIALGYADGLLRTLSGHTEMLLHGRRVPQVGRIAMDMCMLDVSGVPEAQEGDVVTIIGRDGQEEISAGEVATRVGTIPYEILCAIGLRVPRIYMENGLAAQEVCYPDLL